MNTVIEHPQISQAIQREVEKVVRERLGKRLVSVKFKYNDMSEDQCTVIVEITIREGRDKTEGSTAPSLFGLTRQVRGAMGKLGDTVFPVLRPLASNA